MDQPDRGDQPEQDIDEITTNGAPGEGGRQQRNREWVRANFTEIFGVSIAELRARGVDPRVYAQEHQDLIRQYARSRRGGAGPGSGGGFGGGYRWRGGFGIGGLLLVLLVVRLALGGRGGGTGVGLLVVVLLVAAMLLFRFGRIAVMRRKRAGSGRDRGGRSG